MPEIVQEEIIRAMRDGHALIHYYATGRYVLDGLEHIPMVITRTDVHALLDQSAILLDTARSDAQTTWYRLMDDG